MNYKMGLTLILLLVFASVLYPQSTYFIKYKNSVPVTKIENKIRSQKYLPAGKTFSFSDLSPKVNFLAKGIARKDKILGRIIKVTFDKKTDKSAFLALKYDDPDIEYIEPSHTYKMELVPNDSLVSQQWGLEKVKAFDAWNITTGSDSVLLGIIDTGIDYNHPDLKNKMYINPGETGFDSQGNDKRYNGIDDDNNGFIDDYRGWDFTNRVGFPFDTSGGDYLNWDNNPFDPIRGYNGTHGTFVAGIAGAETDNLIGVAGTAPDIKILNVRAFDNSGQGDEDDVAAGILYAVQMGARVINMSFGDYSFSYVLKDVIRYAYSQGVVLVGSAGNQNSSEPHYPSGYSEVICVGNSTENDYRAGSSNYGSTLDLMAPGSGIWSTDMSGGYTMAGGTSAASPFVAGAAALILSKNYFSNEEVKQILKTSSDDISEPGWDIYTGAGRLNIYTALSIGAPSVVKFEHPKQNYSTYKDSVPVSATILSPYFVNYQLDYGEGLNPDNWTTLIQDGRNQFNNKLIYTLDVSQLPESVYTLRIIVYLNNGRTLEERVNFNIIRTAPKANILNIGPSFYGNKTTILASAAADQRCVIKMYYRPAGSGGSFNFITLDAFNTNNQFVSYAHYGFIPIDMVGQNQFYEIYLQAENLVGFKTTLANPITHDTLFVIPTNFNADLSAEYTLPFQLPQGSLYRNPVNFLSNDKNEILFSELYPSPDIYYSLYQIVGNDLAKIDSIKNKLPRDVGDFNGNGMVDLLSSNVGTGYIDEQTGSSSFVLQNKFTDSSKAFWPGLEGDFDNSGQPQVMAFDQQSDTSIIIWKFNNDFSSASSIHLSNYTRSKYNYNLLGPPSAAVTDMNKNGRKELWFIDQDGDIFSYEANGSGGYNKFIQDSTSFISSSEFLTAGDFDGDGTEEIAVLLHSISYLDIAPFYLLNIYKYSGNSLDLIYQRSIVDAAGEFGGGGTFQNIENSIRFADLDNDGTDELILFVYPHSYIFKNESGDVRIISYKEDINSNSVFVGDLNMNGVPEIAFPTKNGITFSEFAVSKKAGTPYNITGYSLDSMAIALSWEGSGQFYYIYRGLSPDSLTLIDSTTEQEYTNLPVMSDVNYYYAVQGYDITRPEPLSDLSATVKVYSHSPAKVISVISQTPKNVQVTFSGRVSNTVENLQSFNVQGTGFPNSVSPANQFSYILSYNKSLPAGKNTLIVTQLKDYYGSPINSDTTGFMVEENASSEEFFVSSFEILGPYKIKIVFNKDVNESAARDINNYSFEPANKVTSVDVDNSSRNIIYLNLNGNKPVGSIGKEYRLKILNLSSADGLTINSGAGGYLVLTGYAEDLSDVYVYPNPAKVASGKMTFANLPQRAKIIIWNINGIRINELSETDGNGGVDYDMKDESGNELSTGVYIYRIVRLDNLDNEVEEKIGKFAVIR